MEMKKMIGENIRCFREKLGLTQEQVQDFLGVDRTLLSRYENGERDVPFDHLTKLSDLFGVEMEVFVEENPINKEANLALVFRASDITKEDFDSISQFQRIVKSYIKMNVILNA